MKKAIYIIIIVLFITGICLIEQLLVQQYFKVLNERTSNISNILSTIEDLNTNDLPYYTDDLHKYWTAKENILCTFINHKDIEEIGEEISRMQTAIVNNDKDKYKESLNLIRYYIISYQHIIGINFQNIF